MHEIVAVDVGQSGSRVATGRGAERIFVGSRLAPGVELAELVVAILRAADVRRADAVLLSLTGLRGRVTRVAEIGAACQRQTGCELVAVCDDGLAWNLGALEGVDGAILAAGGGVVAVGRHGLQVSHVDGIGSDLGDDGGGFWLGSRGLRAALRGQEGRGPRTTLQERAAARFGDLADLPYAGWDAATFHGEAIAFARDVLEAAAEADEAAREVATRGARRLAASATAACHSIGLTGPLARLVLVGGLMNDAGYRGLVEAACRDIDPAMEIHQSRGDAMDGLYRLDLDRPRPMGSLLGWWQA